MSRESGPSTGDTLARSSRPSTPARRRTVPGTAGYRRVMVAMFAAGMATFVLLYDVQALLPELVEAYDVSPTRAPWRCR